MFAVIVEDTLKAIAEKVKIGERLSRADGIALMQSHDLISVGGLADSIRKQRWGHKVFYTTNLNINYSNVCVAEYCLFCSFARLPGQEGGWTYTLEEIENKVRAAVKKGLVEAHIVGGLNPAIPFQYFTEMFQRIKAIDPKIFIKAFTPVEIDYFALLYKMSVEEVLTRLREAGMDAMPGGGAEILKESVRKKICRDKISGERWLEIHGIAHGMGFKTNATMLYGHIENAEDRIDHMLSLREQQDKTGGFQAFVPLAFHPDNNRMRKVDPPDGFLDLKVIAVGRLMLDNFAHIKALWTYLKPKLAQTALSFGADDLGGTLIGETIVHMAGSGTPEELERRELNAMIEQAGKIPVEVNTFYDPVVRER